MDFFINVLQYSSRLIKIQENSILNSTIQTLDFGYIQCPESDLFGEKTLVAFGVQGHTEVPSAAARFPPHTQPASQFEKRRGLI